MTLQEAIKARDWALVSEIADAQGKAYGTLAKSDITDALIALASEHAQSVVTALAMLREHLSEADGLAA